MTLEKLTELVLATLRENKASDITTLDVSEFSNITDLMIIASGRSNRQIVSIAENLIEKVKYNKVSPYGAEGKKYGEWVLVDLGDIIVHIMHPETREYYQLEKLWSITDNPDSAEVAAY